MALSLASQLEALLQEWRQLLRLWAQEGLISRAASEVLGLDREPPLLQELVRQWAAGEFRALPPIKLLPSTSMPGVAGAYALSTGTIYLNQEWLQSASRQQALAVLSKELGHHLDALLNRSDTPGDAGELLTEILVKGKNDQAESNSIETLNLIADGAARFGMAGRDSLVYRFLDSNSTPVLRTISSGLGLASANAIADPNVDITAEPDATMALALPSATGYDISTSTAVSDTPSKDDRSRITWGASPASPIDDGAADRIDTLSRTNLANSGTAIDSGTGASLGSNSRGVAAATASQTLSFAAGTSSASVPTNPGVDTNTSPGGSVTISGAPIQGQTLIASNILGNLNGIPSAGTWTITYQWKANGIAISGATGSSYLLTQADVGKTITVTAFYAYSYDAAAAEAIPYAYWEDSRQVVTIPESNRPRPLLLPGSGFSGTAPEIAIDQSPTLVGEEALMVYMQMPDNSTWRAAQLPLTLDSVPISGLRSLNDGRLVGVSRAYYPMVLVDPVTGSTERIPLQISLYGLLTWGDQIFLSGYPNARTMVFDTTRPMTWVESLPGRPGVPENDPSANPRLLRFFGQDTGQAHIGMLPTQGADGNIYMIARRHRYFYGFALVWLSPDLTDKGELVSSVFDDEGAFDHLQITGMQPVDGGRRLIISTQVQYNKQLPGDAPRSAAVFLFDVAERKIIGRHEPLPGAQHLAVATMASPEIMIGSAINYRDGAASTAFRYNTQTLELEQVQHLNWSLGDNFRYETDGQIWGSVLHGNYSVIFTLNPCNLQATPVGRTDDPRDLGLLFQRGELYLSGYNHIMRLRRDGGAISMPQSNHAAAQLNADDGVMTGGSTSHGSVHTVASSNDETQVYPLNFHLAPPLDLEPIGQGSARAWYRELEPGRMNDQSPWKQLVWFKKDSRTTPRSYFALVNFEQGTLRELPAMIPALEPTASRWVNGKLYIGMNLPARLAVFDPATETLTDLGPCFSGGTLTCFGIEVSPDGQLVLIGAQGSDVSLFNPQTGQFTYFGELAAEPGGGTYAYSASADERYLYVAIRSSDPWELVRLDRQTGERRVILTAPPQAHMVVDSRGGGVEVSNWNEGWKRWYFFRDSVSSISSTATSAIANINDAPTGTVLISGTPIQGETLTAASTIADLDGIPTSGSGAIRYQWKADGIDIPAATANTYVLTQSEVGKAITVTAAYLDQFGTAEYIHSAPTQPVEAVLISLSVSPASIRELAATGLIYTFTRTGPTINPLTVNYTVSGSATPGSDYTGIAATPATKTVTFAAGSATAMVTVDPIDDFEFEANETVALSIAAGSGYTIGARSAIVGTILNDDLPLVTLELAADSAAEDGSDNLMYTFRRMGLATSALRVNYTVGGTATLGTDYTGINSSGAVKTVTFAAGSATATVIVDPRVDTTIEPDETVVLSLKAGTGYSIGSNATATGTISNDDLPQITLALASPTVAEDGTANLIYTFRRTGPTTTGLSINYTVGGTASLGTDYTGIAATPTIKTIGFAAASATATLSIDPTNDNEIELNETVVLTLAAGTGYRIATTAAVTGTIRNDDLPLINLAMLPAAVAEDGATNLVFTFSRTGPTTAALTVNYSISGTATPGSDYTGIAATTATRTISFATGASMATLTINPTADTTIEPDESVMLSLATGTGYRIGTTTAVRGMIRNDDIRSATSYMMKPADSSLTLTGTNPINGTGNNLGNRIIGNSANNQISGATGKDILTGGGTADSDRFIFSRLSDSLLLEPINGTGDYFDEITDFNSNDRIVVPASVVTRRLTDSIGAAASIAPEAITALVTSSAFAANAVVAFTTNSHTGSFLALNDGRAGFQSDSDAVVFLRNYSISSANPIEFI